MKNAFIVLLAALSAASAGWRALNPRVPGVLGEVTCTGPAHVAHCSGATCQSMGSGTDAYVTALRRADDA